jgi:DNA topoisomerase I
MAGLVYVSYDQTGYRRMAKGGSFIYLDEKRVPINDKEEIERIKNLRIPPAWQEVWICSDSSGHLQATGLDLKGRRQYLYHPEWAEFRNATKFHKILEFGRALPSIRERIAKDLRKKFWPKEKVMALIVKILDEAYLRIGNEVYKEQNETFGLTTLRRRHLKVEKGKVAFEYKAKSGKYRKVCVTNNQLSNLIKRCSELPGYEIFRYIGDDGKSYAVDSIDVNNYLKEISGKDFSSKNFRTWAASILAIENLEEAKKEVENNQRKTLLPTLIKIVSAKLGNTPSICREYYIHPAILKVIEEDKLSLYNNRKCTHTGELKPVEQMAISIIEDYEQEFAPEEVLAMEENFCNQ